MTSVPKHPILRVTEEDVEITKKFYGLEDVQRINDSLDALEEWIQKQEHLAETSKYMNRAFLERLFFLAQGSIENAKKKLDKVLTIRSLLPELCLNKTPSEFENLSEVVRYVILPKISPKDTTRVMVSQIVPERLNDFSFLALARYMFMVGEYRMHFDYNLGDRYIVDLKHTSIVSKMNPITLKKGDALAEAYGNKIKGIHVVNAPPLIDAFLHIMKQAMREKVASRMHVHKSYEELHEHIPKEILPKDFGGDELPVEKLCELWTEHFKTEEAIKIVEEVDKFTCDESKRVSSRFNEEYMGMPGSFRQLSVD